MGGGALGKLFTRLLELGEDLKLVDGAIYVFGQEVKDGGVDLASEEVGVNMLET